MSKFRTRQLWPILTIILAIALIVSLFSGSNLNVPGNTVDQEEAGTTVVDFVEEYLLQGQAEAELVEVTETSGLYIVTLNIQDQELPVYLTKNGEYLFPQGINLEEFQQALEENKETEPEEETPIEVEITEEDHVLGEADAPITIVEYSDYECPFCREWHGTNAIPSRDIDQDKAFDKLKEEYIDTGKVKFIFRPFVLSYHENAQKAAEGAECAGEQSKFWEFHEKAFGSMDVSLEKVKEFAEELDLNMEEFNECLDSNKYEQKVKDSLISGQELGVSGTPAFIINGKLISGAVPFENIKSEIEAALAE